jgi:hypothetical protein
VSPVKYEQGSYIPQDDILHDHLRVYAETRKSIKLHFRGNRKVKLSMKKAVEARRDETSRLPHFVGTLLTGFQPHASAAL